MLVCPTCGTQLVQKSRVRLLTAGCSMLAIAAIASMMLPLWLQPATVILVLTGAYLIQWATRGAALWCRNCKKFPNCLQ